jgi:hypothetical protein
MRVVVIRWSFLLFVAAVAPWAASCSGDGGNDGGPSDATDGGTEDDSDSDCPAEPASCEDIGESEEAQYFGCCFGGSVYFCEGGELKTIDCEDDGNDCGYNAKGNFMDCV